MTSIGGAAGLCGFLLALLLAGCDDTPEKTPGDHYRMLEQVRQHQQRLQEAGSGSEGQEE